MCVRIFFRDITIIGLKNIPERGPVIFCGNHSNQIVDGLLVYATAGQERDVRFMVAGKSMRHPVMKHFFHANKAVAVERAQDLAKKGPGTVYFEDNLTLRGIDTKFTK